MMGQQHITTISLPRTQPPDYRIVFPDWDSSRHVLNVRRLPEWFAAGDVVEYRQGRTFARSLTQTEPRWRRLLRAFRQWVGGLLGREKVG